MTTDNVPAAAALGTLIVLAAITALGFGWPAIQRRVNRRLERSARVEFDRLYPPPPVDEPPLPGTLQHLTRVSHAVCEAYETGGVARWWTVWARSTSQRRRTMELGVLEAWSGHDAEVGD